MPSSPTPVTLDNWRDPPFVSWAFQNLEQLVPAARIGALNADFDTTSTGQLASQSESHIGSLSFRSTSGSCDLDEMYSLLCTDALVVIHNGELAHEYYAPNYDARQPHTIFSVSKSLTSLLAGIYVADGSLDVNRTPSSYMPDLAGSAYDDCTIQQLLDMQIAIDFEESYLDRTGQFNQYRMAMQWVPQDPSVTRHSLRSFAGSLARLDASKKHGEIFRYRSPNSDVLGMLVETVSGQRFAELFSRKIWKPIGARTDAYVTLDHEGGARTGGGICATARDLARFGELVRNHGRVDGVQLVPEAWVVDSLEGGDHGAWSQGDFVTMAPDGRYRNKWYNTGRDQNFGFGIHGQVVYVDREAQTSIVHFSSHADPLNSERDPVCVKFLQTISESFR